MSPSKTLRDRYSVQLWCSPLCIRFLWTIWPDLLESKDGRIAFFRLIRLFRLRFLLTTRLSRLAPGQTGKVCVWSPLCAVPSVLPSWHDDLPAAWGGGRGQHFVFRCEERRRPLLLPSLLPSFRTAANLSLIPGSFKILAENILTQMPRDVCWSFVPPCLTVWIRPFIVLELAS